MFLGGRASENGFPKNLKGVALFLLLLNERDFITHPTIATRPIIIFFCRLSNIFYWSLRCDFKYTQRSLLHLLVLIS